MAPTENRKQSTYTRQNRKCSITTPFYIQKLYETIGKNLFIRQAHKIILNQFTLHIKGLSMCKLSKREKEVLEILLEGVVPSAAAKQLGMNSEKEIATYKSRVRRKIFIAKKFLREMKRYQKVLYPEKTYKV
jgi:FixJ family two-component response regulator